MRRFKIVIYRSNKHFYTQMVDSKTGKTVFGLRDGTAKDFAAKAKEHKIKECLFARVSQRHLAEGKKYHYGGRIKEFIEFCRKEGLEI